MNGKSNDPDGVELETAVAYQVVRAARVLRNHLVRFLAERGAELTPEQYFIFFKINSRPGASQAELADPLLGDYPNVTRLVDSLVRRGLAERRPAPDDRRRHALYLTEEGRKLAGELIPAVLAERGKLTAGLPPEAVANFTAVLHAVERNAAERGGMLTEGE